MNLTLGSPFVIKLTTVDTNGNMISREEYVQVVDMTASVINEFTTIYHVLGHIKVDVNVSDDSGGSVAAIAYLYLIFVTNTELDSYWIELTNGVRSVTFTDLDPERMYIVELSFRDSSCNSRFDNRELYPNGGGIVVNT